MMNIMQQIMADMHKEKAADNKESTTTGCGCAASLTPEAPQQVTGKRNLMQEIMSQQHR